MRQYLPSAIAVLVVAVIAHLVSVWVTPSVIMNRAISRIGGAGMNQIHFQKRPDETARGIVRPSPDLIYSVCPYDLSAGPLRVRSPVPNDTYWSVSLFDDATNNYYVMDDREAHAAKESVVDFVIVRDAGENTEGMKAVVSPSSKGLALFRTLVYADSKLPEIDALRREATCATWHASLSDVSSKTR
jgi:uncharacterized membrane protein